MTSDDKTAKALRAFFTLELMPVADRMKREGTEFLATKLDKDAESYYITRKKRSMSREDFEWGGAASVEDFSKQLTEFWLELGQDRLAALVPKLAAFAEKLQTKDEQEAEVSPFIYVMY